MGVLFFGELLGHCDPASFAQSFPRCGKASGEYLGTQHFSAHARWTRNNHNTPVGRIHELALEHVDTGDPGNMSDP
jgi:hypothetical protein